MNEFFLAITPWVILVIKIWLGWIAFVATIVLIVFVGPIIAAFRE